MSDVVIEADATETPREFNITIKISDQNLQYKSDFNEPETLFWIEAVKNLIINNAFSKGDLQKID